MPPLATSRLRLGRALSGAALELPIERVLGNHWHIRGRTGSMKTVFATSLSMQWLAHSHHLVAVLDLGGDKAWAWQMLERCRQTPTRPCRLFSLDPGHGGCYFDPIKAVTAADSNLSRVASGICFGLNLVYGEGYGKSWFGRVNTATIIEALAGLVVRGLHNPGLHDLARELSRMARRLHPGRDASEALYAVDQLLRYTRLDTHPDPEANLDMRRAFEQGEALYFFLPTIFDPQPARAVAALAAWSIALEAARRTDQGDPVIPTHLFIDEFAQVVGGKSLEDLLTQVRKTGVQIYLLHQSTDQLLTRDHDLASIVRDNCTLKVLFTATNERDLDELQFYSLDVVRPRRGHSIQAHSISTSQQESVEPALSRNQIREVSDTAMQAFFCQQLGDGHHEPEPFEIEPACSKQAHAAWSLKPLRLTGPADDVPPLATGDDPARAARLTELRALLAAKQAELQWRPDSEAGSS